MLHEIPNLCATTKSFEDYNSRPSNRHATTVSPDSTLKQVPLLTTKMMKATMFAAAILLSGASTAVLGYPPYLDATSQQCQYQYAEQQQMLEDQQEQSFAQENFDQEQALMQQNYLKLFEGGAAAQQAGSCLDINIPTLVGFLNVRVCPDDSTGCGLVRVVLGTLVNT
ncbi:hypothetical protein GBAR_LOCUS25193, partial [Geodia barretti]